MKQHYFDYAAATPLSEDVFAAMKPYLNKRFYNPSANYLEAQTVREDINKARSVVAKIIGVKTSEIIFTAGGTEANNLAIQGIMKRYPEANCIVSAIEHPAVLEPAKNFKHKLAPVLADGRIDIAKLNTLIDDKTVLISLMYVNNEVGTIQPLAQVSKLIKDVLKDRVKSRNPLPLIFHTDACQAPNYLQVLANTLGVDMLTLNGGKIYGPKQSGVLYVKTGIEMEPLILGGGQERDKRSGTENVAGIVGFATALDLAQSKLETEARRIADIQKVGIDFIKENLPTATINASLSYRIPNNIHLTLPGQDNERLMMALDEQGFMVATGSACSASSDEPSHVLKAMEISDQDARSSLRITLGCQSTSKELISLLSSIKKLIQTA